MKRLLLLLFLTVSTWAFAQQAGSAPTQVTVIRAGTLIDGKSDKPRRDQVIVIRGNRIESVSDAASAKIPAGATVIDLIEADGVAWADRFAHAHFSAGRRSRAWRL